MSFWCLQISQKIHEIFSRISAIASKKRSNQKNKGNLYVPLIGGFYFDSLTLLFWFDLFSEARAEILEIISWLFLGDLKTPKGHFKITWPLVTMNCIYVSSRPVLFFLLKGVFTSTKYWVNKFQEFQGCCLCFFLKKIKISCITTQLRFDPNWFN